MEDRITASIAAGLSNMPEENQVLALFLFVFCIVTKGVFVCSRLGGGGGEGIFRVL